MHVTRRNDFTVLLDQKSGTNVQKMLRCRIDTIVGRCKKNKVDGYGCTLRTDHLGNREIWWVIARQERPWVIASKVPNVTMFTGIALRVLEFHLHNLFVVEIDPYLIKVGASPLKNTRIPSFFQLRTTVEIVAPPP